MTIAIVSHEYGNSFFKTIAVIFFGFFRRVLFCVAENAKIFEINICKK